MELRSRQASIPQVQDQISYLQDKYNKTAQEKNRSDQECSQKLIEGLQVVDSLVKELDELRSLNRIEEEHQMQLLQQVSMTCADHDSKNVNLEQVTASVESQVASNKRLMQDVESLQSQIRDSQ